MQHPYLETRNLPNHPSATLAADIARHLQYRQYLGSSLIICENPNALLSATRKQWFKGSRILQRQRASTLNTEEILRLTHAIMHMQNMRFVARMPREEPDADVFFIYPEQMGALPLNCFSLYVTTEVPTPILKEFCSRLITDALVINYLPQVNAEALAAKPKVMLEERVLSEWKQLCAFLAKHRIYPARLVEGNALQFAAMDEALDTLLDTSSEFLREAANFQHSINLAQPFADITSEQCKMFEAVTRLAHRVQALTPGNFNHYLMSNFGDHGADTFFLRDVASELYIDLEIAAAKDTTN